MRLIIKMFVVMLILTLSPSLLMAQNNIPEVGANYLTKEEQDYLRNHPPFTICEQYDIYPLSGVKNGQLIGMRGDYVDEIVKRTGLKFKILGSSRQFNL